MGGECILKVGRNELCPCGSGKKYKKCCANEITVVNYKNVTDIYDNYFIIYDKEKVRELTPSLHLYSPMLADVSKALWYCLHLPRNGLDVIFSPEGLFVEGDSIHQHNIHIIPSDFEKDKYGYLQSIQPTLYISEDSCYEEAARINAMYPAKLGTVRMQDLSSSLLESHWSVIKDRVQATLQDLDLPKEKLKLLEVSPVILNGKERTALPNIFLANQMGDTNNMLEVFRSEDFSFKRRVHGTKKQLTYFKMWYDLGNKLDKVSDNEILRMLKKSYIYTPSSLVITLPGAPRFRKSFGVDSHKHEISEEEKDLINFFGVQRAISQQGIWLEGNQLNSDIFNKLANLERHFHATKRKKDFILQTMKEFGQLLSTAFNIDNLGEYALASSRIIAFTDFPIGLAIPPGYSDPLASMTAISYRPLTPLTNTFKYGLNQVPNHYIGHGQGFKILIIECLSESDHIRKFSDIGWAIMIKELAGNKLIKVNYEIAESIEEIEGIIDTYQDVDFLIISAHGTYDRSGVSGIVVGEEFWLPKPTLEVPPVVILSACHVATKGRGNYSVNNAFLDAGALAILGTLIPVDVIENSSITQRFFFYISETLEGHHDCKDLADAWKRVVNANVFSSILNSTKKLSEWALTNNSEQKNAYELFFEKIKEKGEVPGNIHQQTVEILKEIANEAGIGEYLDIILERNGYITEGIFYIFSGYPEKVLIQPQLWMKH